MYHQWTRYHWMMCRTTDRTERSCSDDTGDITDCNVIIRTTQSYITSSTIQSSDNTDVAPRNQYDELEYHTIARCNSKCQCVRDTVCIRRKVVVGYWTTPSRVTRISLLLAGFLERLNVVVLPSPVKTSRVLSMSKFVMVSPRIWPNRTSVDTGSWLNTIVESESRPKPKVGEEDSCACWRTPLIEISWPDEWSFIGSVSVGVLFELGVCGQMQDSVCAIHLCTRRQTDG